MAKECCSDVCIRVIIDSIVRITCGFGEKAFDFIKHVSHQAVLMFIHDYGGSGMRDANDANSVLYPSVLNKTQNMGGYVDKLPSF